ncbi:MAG TPA: hypothetical protein VKK79_01830 [Candidatus Lokiarchaeia archaeon]|nr:hypothetical protein [Candidatus Lokiarchaeia archaeon]
MPIKIETVEDGLITYYDPKVAGVMAGLKQILDPFVVFCDEYTLPENYLEIYNSATGETYFIAANEDHYNYIIRSVLQILLSASKLDNILWSE